MKIMVNYDLIDKIRESKTGISLCRYTTVVGFTNAIGIPMISLGSYLGNASLGDTLELVLKLFGYSLFYNGIQAFGYSFFRKKEAVEELAKLSMKLKDICVETSPELLKSAYQYEVNYSINFDSFPPKIEQKKYIMVPVENYWGNNERSLMQEHVIGTRDYALSYGEPEKKKVYSYMKKRTFSSGR